MLCFFLAGVKIAVTDAEAQSMNDAIMSDAEQLERCRLHLVTHRHTVSLFTNFFHLLPTTGTTTSSIFVN